MKNRTRTTRLACAALCVVAAFESSGAAQTSVETITRRPNVIYGEKFGVALTLEVFTPAPGNGIGVIWVVGSSGRSSREQTLQESFQRRIAPLLTRGYTVFAVIHGSAPVFNVQDQVSDVRRAVRFVRSRAGEFGIDGQRLGISGSSAGGLLALIVAMQERDGDPTSADVVERESSRVQAAGSFFAPTDLQNFGAADVSVVDLMQKQGGSVDPTFQFYEADPKSGVRRLLTAKEEIVRMLQEYSPVTHVASSDPPTLLIHGDQDKAVPIQQSRQLVERLNAAKVPARLVVREGVGHAYPGWEGDAALIAEWFDTHLRPR